MKNTLLFIFTYLAFLNNFAQQKYDNTKVKSEVKIILSDYEKTLNAFINLPEKDKKRIAYSKKLKDNFESTSVWVFNDLDSNSNDTSYFKMFEYIKALPDFMPPGSDVSLDLNNCKIEDVIGDKDRNGYTLKAHTKKTINTKVITENKVYTIDSTTNSVDSTLFEIKSDTTTTTHSERLTFYFKLKFYGYTYKGVKIAAVSKWKSKPKFKPLPKDELWWVNLTPDWQTIFRDNATLLEYPDKLDLQKVEFIYNLDLTNKNISTVEPLSRVKQLRTLVLSKNPIESLKGIENNLQLAELHINETKIVDLNPLEKLTSLQILHCKKLGLETLEPLKNLTNLIELDCSQNLIKDIKPLKNMMLLEHLNISLNEEIETIEPLRGKVNLTKFWMRKMKVTDISALSTCYNMVELDVFSNEIGTIEPLRKLKKIAKLDIGYAKISSLSPLAGHRMLTHFECQGNAITDITVVKNFYALRRLNIARTSVTDLTPLSKLEYLQRIDIFYTKISVEEKDRFKKKHPKCKILYY